MEKVQKNNLLNFFKLIASFFVIFIHCKFPGFIGDFIETIARFAVPFFFIISGYYVYDNSYEKITLKIKKLIKILFFLLFAYFIFDVFLFVTIKNMTFIDFSKQVFNKDNLILFLIFNNTSTIASHLWFIPALICSYIILLVFYNKKNNLMNIFMWVPIISIPLSMFLINYFEYNIFRNWFFVGLPLLSIGYYIKSKEKYLKKFSNKSLYLLSCLSILILFAERLIMKLIFQNKLDFYFGSLFLSIFLFIYCIKNSKYSNKIINISNDYSSNIYYYHYLIYLIFDNFVFVNCTSIICRWIYPFAVLSISLLTSIIINCLFEGRK